MKINQIITETSAGATGSGSVATVSSPLGATKTRNASIYGDQKVGSLFKGKKTNKPFANSITEGAVKQLSMDLKGGPDGLSDEEFKKKYGKTKAEVRKEMKNKPEPVKEADLHEEDKIIAVGKGHKLKTGLHGKGDEPKFRGFKAPFKSAGVHVSDKRGNSVCECSDETLAPIVAKALNAYAIANESAIQGGVIAGGMANESEKVNEKAVSKKQQKFMGMVHAVQKGEMKAPSKEVAKVAKSIPKKAAKDFAKTKHKGLPEKVKKD